MKPALQSDASGARPAGSPPRLLYGDPMRVAGALAVIVFHVAAYGQDRRGAIGAAAWWGCNLVSCATLWCVPIFILLSGALLLDPERSDTLGGFYRRRLGRIGIPFLFWCAFYLAYRKVVLGGSLSPSVVVRALLAGTPFYHLHFLYILIGLYLFTPMFRVFASHAGAGLLGLAAVGALAFATADEAAGSVIGGSSVSSAFVKFIPFIGYYLAGCWLRGRRLSSRGLAAALAVAALMAVLTAVAISLPSERVGRHLMFLLGWLGPTAVVLSLCVFLVLGTAFAQYRPAGPVGRFVVERIAPATLGIYLIHPVFLHLARQMGLTGLWPISWVGIPLVSVLVFAASLGATLLIQQVPYLRRVVG